jgi:hypothetical protein
MVNTTLLSDHGIDNELKKESYLGRSGLRSHMLKTGSLAMELRMSKEKLATGYCLKSHKWITAIKV